MEPLLRKVAYAATVLAAVLFVLTTFVPDGPQAVRQPFIITPQATARLKVTVANVERLHVCLELPRNDVVRLADGFVLAWSVMDGERVVSSSEDSSHGVESVPSRSTRLWCVGDADVVDGREYTVQLRVVARPDGAEGLPAALVAEPDLASLRGGVRVGQLLFQLMTACIVVAAASSLLSRRGGRRDRR